MSAPATPISASLQDRLEFLGLGATERTDIETLQPLLERHLPAALDKFYAHIREVPEAARFFSGDAQIERARTAQSTHWAALFAGRVDDDYAQSSRRIGLRHARIGLEPRWYVGGYARILDSLVRDVIADFVAGSVDALPNGLFGARKASHAQIAADMERLGSALGTLIKSVMLDIDLGISSYFDVMTEEAAAAQAASAAKISRAVEATGKVLGDLAAGDLTTRIEEEFEGELERIKHDTNAVADRLTAVMTQLRQTSRSVKTATSEILGGANDLADRTSRQAASIQQTATTMNQIAATVAANAVSAGDASGQIADIVSLAEQGNGVMGEASAAMERIRESSSRIAGIVGLIDDIAFQTNLLALNASVEAARAGDAGKGFAVVAVEVRRLAQSAAGASRDIKALIDGSTADIRNGEQLVHGAEKTLTDIVEGIRRFSALTGEIAEANRSQALSIDEVNQAMRDMDAMTQHNAALVEQTSAAVEQTDAHVGELDALVEVFRIDEGLDDEEEPAVSAPRYRRRA